MQEIEHLVKMANQIADNFSFHGDAEKRTADHLRRFWAPSMRRVMSPRSTALRLMKLAPSQSIIWRRTVSSTGRSSKMPVRSM